MGILLAKMKVFSPFVKKHFSSTPKQVSLAFFLTCFLIEFPYLFAFKVNPSGSYYYYDSNGLKQTTVYYSQASSDFSATWFGQILLGFTQFFLNQFLMLLIGITLNIVSIYLFETHLRQKRRDGEQLELSSIHNRPTTQREIE